MPAEEREVRIDITAADFRSYGNTVIEKLTEFVTDNPKYTVAPDNREGIRVSTENGWFLLRLSVHDPVMPLNFESKRVGGVDADVADIKPFFEQFDELKLPDNF